MTANHRGPAEPSNRIRRSVAAVSGFALLCAAVAFVVAPAVFFRAN
jgi:hypothetical protein